MLTVNQLRTFVAVARRRHFTRAAEDLQVAQPSVSYQVRELERQLRLRLVEVVGRKVYLTDAGERLAERGEALLNELEDLERELRDYAAATRGRLRLGATRTVGGYALPATLAAFERQYPSVEVQLTIDNTERIEDLLLARALDLAVVEWKVTSPALVSQPLCQDDLVLVAAPGHPLARCGRVRLDDLRGQRFIMREVGSGTRALAEQGLAKVLAEVKMVMALDQPEAIVRLVESGLGLTFISRTIVAGRLAAGTLCEVPVEGLSLRRDFSFVRLREKQLSPAGRAFEAFITAAWSGKDETPGCPGQR